MILVTGGVASGKRTYLRMLGYGDRDMSANVDDGCPVLLDAQELVRGVVDTAALAERLAESKQAVAVVEVGSGIVPLDPEDRAWRDRAGALARELAARSDTAVRMVCGIPVALKGELPQEGRPCRS